MEKIIAYIYLWKEQQSYLITIETLAYRLIPITRKKIVDDKYATFMSSSFVVKEISNYPNTNITYSKISGLVCKGYDKEEANASFYIGKTYNNTHINIFKSLVYVYYFYKEEMALIMPNGWFKYYKNTGKLTQTIYKKNYHIIKQITYYLKCRVKWNYKKNTTIVKSRRLYNMYPFIAYFRRNDDEPIFNKIYKKEYLCYSYDNITDRKIITCRKEYSTFGNLVYRSSYRNRHAVTKNHGLFLRYNSRENKLIIEIYWFNRLFICKNLQIFRKSPWNPVGNINKISVF
jgi:hypothetical protein